MDLKEPMQYCFLIFNLYTFLHLGPNEEPRKKIISGECRPKFENFNIGEFLRLGKPFLYSDWLTNYRGPSTIERVLNFWMHPHQINNKNQPMPTKVKGREFSF
jgi:hypothetical protein